MDRDRTKTLIDKYFDGTTTDVEEQELKGIIIPGSAGSDTPAPSDSPKGERSEDDDELAEDRRVLRALFAFEEQERAVLRTKQIPLPTTSLPIGVAGGGRSVGAVVGRHRRFDMFLASAAASAAVLFAIAVGSVSREKPSCYAVINGKVYTDREVVEQQAEEALMMVSSSEDDSFGALRLMQ